jgi:hypothetical protein
MSVSSAGIAGADHSASDDAASVEVDSDGACGSAGVFASFGGIGSLLERR